MCQIVDLFIISDAWLFTVVESDFDSEEKNKRKSRRVVRKSKPSYKEVDSDETEVDDADDSFHSSELDDSDFEEKMKKKEKQKEKKKGGKEKSAKGGRIRKDGSSSESTEETEDEDDAPRKKKVGKKPQSKSARWVNQDN